jgi:hypothetical protein
LVPSVGANHHPLTKARSPMFDHLRLRTWIGKAAAVFSGWRGAGREPAPHAGWSRQTL